MQNQDTSGAKMAILCLGTASCALAEMKQQENANANKIKYFFHIYNSFIPNYKQSIHHFLLPLNRCRWFTADIIHHPVYSFYIINDLVRDIGQKLIRQM